MVLSPVYLQSDVPTNTQKVLLVALAFFVPPLSIFLMTKPNYTVKTKEFLISCILTLTIGVVGTIYTIIFILSTSQNARDNTSREGYFTVGDVESQPVGYFRVGDAESQPKGPTEVSHQSGDIQRNSPENTRKAEANKPYTDAQISNTQASSEPVLPTYDEIEGNSTSDKRDDMVKFGDNKIQH